MAARLHRSVSHRYMPSVRLLSLAMAAVILASCETNRAISQEVPPAAALEGTLPPVVVRPSPEAPPVTTAPAAPSSLAPPASSTSRAATPAPDTTPGGSLPFDAPVASDGFASFPSLADQVLGGARGATNASGLNGVLRDPTSLFDAPQAGTILDRRLIEEKMAPDMFRAVQNEVGVLMQQTGRGQASPFIRGLTGEQVLILVDGIRMNNALLRSGPNQYFNTIDPGQVERIEVIRGAQSVLWGSDAIGGAINIVTRGADPNRGEYRGGSFTQYFSSADSGSYSRGNVEGWVQNQGVFAGGSYLNVRDLDRGGDLGRQPFTNYDQYAGDVKYNLAIDDQSVLTFAVSHFVQRDLPRSDRFLPFVLGPPSNTPRPTFFDPQQRDLAYLRYEGVTDATNPLYDAWSFTTSYALNREGLDELRSPSQRELGKLRDDTVGFQLALARDADDFGRFTYGADYYHDDIDASKYRVNPLNPNQAPSARPPQLPDDSLADRMGVFWNWDVAVTDRLRASTGVRYENANLSGTPEFTINGGPQDIYFSRTYQDWVASIGLTYELTESTHLVGGVYEGYRAPTLDDLTANKTFLQNAQSSPNLGSLNVQPENSWTYEVGFKGDGDRYRYQVMQWWMQLDDYIARSVDGAGNVFLGNHQASLHGTELDAEWLLGGGWATYGNFWYTFGRDLTENEPFSRIPPTQGILGLRYREPVTRGYFDIYTWLVRHQDRYNSVNLTDSRFPVGGTPGYGTLNLRMGRSIGSDPSQRISLALENLTDKYYRVLGSGVDGPGFNAILGYECAW